MTQKATKKDVQRLEEKIHGVEKELKEDIHNFRAEIFKWGGMLMVGLYAMIVGILLKLFGAL